jgi:hypothetical protein
MNEEKSTRMLGTSNIYIAFALRFASCYVLQTLMNKKSNLQERLNPVFPIPNLPWGLEGGNPLCATFSQKFFLKNELRAFGLVKKRNPKRIGDILIGKGGRAAGTPTSPGYDFRTHHASLKRREVAPEWAPPDMFGGGLVGGPTLAALGFRVLGFRVLGSMV